MKAALKTIKVYYYAVLREERGLSEETFKTCSRTAQELYLELQKKHQLRFPLSLLKVSINDSFSDWKKQIRSGDKIVFIPPVAGG